MISAAKFLGITTIALVLMINQQVDGNGLTVCDSPKCLEDTVKIIQYVDTTANPCEDFYQFACGTFLKNAHGDEQHSIWKKISRTIKFEALEIAQEDIREDEHKMVKAAKQFYRACMDENEFKDDFVRTVKKALKAIGGWPILEGSNWKEENFDWLDATYKLRRLGYEFSGILTMDIEKDSVGNNILKIGQNRDHYAFSQDIELLAKLAEYFGMVDKESARVELRRTFNAFNDIYQQKKPQYDKQPIVKIQKTDGIINWLEFINNIIGPKIQFSETDYIIFPTHQYMKNGLELLLKVPKRDQANYMIWEVLRLTYPFVRESGYDVPPHDFAYTPRPRAEYCLEETSKAFTTTVPNPLDVTRLRKYLPKEKKARIEEMISNIKSTSKAAINKVEWIPEGIKEKYLKKLDEMEVIVELSGNYFDDKILDDADFDMDVIEENASFYELLAQATKNSKTAKYSQLKTVSKYLYKYEEDESLMRVNYDKMYMPSALTEYFYDEKRPEYLNYGTLGTLISHTLLEDIWTEIKSKEAELRKCITLGMDGTLSVLPLEFQTLIRIMEVYQAIRGGVAEKISYTAYEEWTKQNGEEPKLFTIEYTPNQLYWISMASLACEPIGASVLYDVKIRASEHQMNSDTLHESLRLNPIFAKDFNCPAQSKLYSSARCQIF